MPCPLLTLLSPQVRQSQERRKLRERERERERESTLERRRDLLITIKLE